MIACSVSVGLCPRLAAADVITARRRYIFAFRRHLRRHEVLYRLRPASETCVRLASLDVIRQTGTR